MILRWIRQWREQRRKERALIYIVEKLKANDRAMQDTIVDLHKVSYDVMRKDRENES